MWKCKRITLYWGVIQCMTRNALFPRQQELFTADSFRSSCNNKTWYVITMDRCAQRHSRMDTLTYGQHKQLMSHATLRAMCCEPDDVDAVLDRDVRLLHLEATITSDLTQAPNMYGTVFQKSLLVSRCTHTHTHAKWLQAAHYPPAV